MKDFFEGVGTGPYGVWEVLGRCLRQEEARAHLPNEIAESVFPQADDRNEQAREKAIEAPTGC
jgi:hypothetical protein